MCIPSLPGLPGACGDMVVTPTTILPPVTAWGCPGQAGPGSNLGACGLTHLSTGRTGEQSHGHAATTRELAMEKLVQGPFTSLARPWMVYNAPRLSASLPGF